MKTVKTILFLMMATGLTAQNALPMVEVTGEGVVKVVPDQVNIDIGISNNGKNVKEIKAENDRLVSEVLNFIKSSGIPDKDVQTQYVSLDKNYDYNTKTSQYYANQTISITLRDLSKYEKFMNGLLETGINRINNVNFATSKIKELEAEARKKAIENAQMKAKEYAQVLNQTIGKAISINENQMNTPFPIYKSSAMRMESDSSDQQTLAVGEMEIRTKVNVSFLLQ